MARTAPTPAAAVQPQNLEAAPSALGAGIVPRDPAQPITVEMRRLLRERWPNGERLTVAWRLAKDLETLETLLLGQPVDPSRIDQDELQRALEPRLVQLVRPIDLLTAA